MFAERSILFIVLTVRVDVVYAFLPVQRRYVRSNLFDVVEQAETSPTMMAIESNSSGLRIQQGLKSFFNLALEGGGEKNEKVGTNKKLFLESLDRLDTLNLASSGRTDLLNKMITEKVLDGISNGSGTSAEILPTRSLDKPGLASTFGSVAQGTWKVIYAPHMTTMAGIARGSFDVQYTMDGDGNMVSHARYSFPVVGEGYLSVSGTYGSVNEDVCRVDFDKVWFKSLTGSDNNRNDDEPYQALEDVPAGPIKDLINKIGNLFFIDGVSVFPVSFLDSELIVFDFELLGTRICAKKI